MVATLDPWRGARQLARMTPATGSDREGDREDAASHATRTTIDELREHFELLDGWEDRYRYLIDLGKALAPMDAALKTEHAKVDGCMSQVWMVGHLEHDGPTPVLRLIADSDAAIVRGLIAVLLAAYDGQPLDVVRATDVAAVFDTLGLGQHVSMNRRNGFFAMVGRIRALPDRLTTAAETPTLSDASTERRSPA